MQSIIAILPFVVNDFSTIHFYKNFFAICIAAPSRLASDVHCGRGTLSGTLRLPRNLVHITTLDGNFFRYAQKRSLRYAPFTKLPTLSPGTPPNYHRRKSNQKAIPRRRIFDSLSGFFAHEYFKSRALRAKNKAAFAYPYAQKPL